MFVKQEVVVNPTTSAPVDHIAACDGGRGRKKNGAADTGMRLSLNAQQGVEQRHAPTGLPEYEHRAMVCTHFKTCVPTPVELLLLALLTEASTSSTPSQGTGTPLAAHAPRPVPDRRRNPGMRMPHWHTGMWA